MRRASRAVIALLVVLVAADAAAYTTITSPASTWRATDIPVSWYLNQNGSADIGIDATEAAVQASFDTWQAVDCCAIAFHYNGRTSMRVTGSDGNNVIAWSESGWGYESMAIAVTQDWFGRSTIEEADIDCNGQYLTWNTTGGGGDVDTQSILTHEIGHFLGLGDLYDGAHSSSTMYGVYSGGTGSRSLADDDMAGCRALYDEACGGCTLDTDCPSGYHCEASACVPNTTSGVLCSACGSPSDCSEGLCLSGWFSDGGTYCGRNCTGSDCPAGFSCHSVTGGASQCAPDSHDCSATAPECTTDSNCLTGYHCSGGTCVPNEPVPECRVDTDCSGGRVCRGGTCVPPEPTLLAFGEEPCASGGECASGLCLDGYCTQSCAADLPLASDGCPAGYYCDDVDCGTGRCRRGGPGAGQVYSPCTADTDCASAYCAFAGGSQLCLVPCNSTEALNEGCLLGETCQPLGGPVCGACLCGAGMFGDPCVNDLECIGGLCRATAEGEAKRCTTPCREGACPFGSTCSNIVNPDGTAEMRCASTGQRLGGRCVDGTECQSGDCTAWGGQRFCSRACGGVCNCPAGLICVGTGGGVQKCVPTVLTSDDGCGCRAPGAPASSGLAGLLGLALFLSFRARRRRG